MGGFFHQVMFGVENELSTFHLDSGRSTFHARFFFWFFWFGGEGGCVVHKAKISHSLLSHMLWQMLSYFHLHIWAKGKEL
jgi:hypothetical protein